MSNRLCEDLSLQNPVLERLNYKFAISAFGVKVHSYLESHDTTLDVLSANNEDAASVTTVGLHIVDYQSAILGTADVPVEEDEIIFLPTTHVGTSQLAVGRDFQALFIQNLAQLIHNFNVDERIALCELNSRVMNDITVDLHQIYPSGAPSSLAPRKLHSKRLSLRNFLDLGLAKCLEDQ